MSRFELQLTVGREEVRAAAARGGEGKVAVDRDELRRLTIQVLAGWVAATRVNDRNELRVLGGHLYQTIFRGEVEDLFLSERQQTKIEKGRRLRLQLRFEDETELVDLPWEYLYYPGDRSGGRDFFLATETDISIMRWTHPEEGNVSSAKAGHQPLQVLLTHSVPEAPEEQSQKLVEAMLDKAGDHPPKVKTTSPFWPDFLENPGEPLPHVLHLVARAGQNESGRRGLALMTAEGENVPIDDEQLVAFLRENEWLPRLVVLQVWEKPPGTGIRSGRALSSVARALMQLGVEAVVAMEYPPYSPRGLTFSTWLYKELSEGASIDSAVQKGRFWVWNLPKAQNERLFFGVPVLYMNHDVQLVERPTKNGQRKSDQQRHRQEPATRTTDSGSYPALAPTTVPAPETSTASSAQPPGAAAGAELDQIALDTADTTGGPKTNPIEPPRPEADPLMLPLLIRANQAAKRLGLDALAGARVVDALQGLTAEQRLNRVLARLRAREQYDREHELLSVVAEVALTHASNEGSVVPGGGRIDPPLAPILRYASATIGGLGLADDAAAQLSRVLVDASIELLGLNESERVDRLFARLREPAQYEHELDVIAAMTEAALVEQLERGGSAVRSSSGGTDPPLAPIIHRGARTIIGLQSDEAEIVRVTQALASLTREIAGMKRDDRLTHLNQLLLVRSRDEPVRELIAMLVFELEEG